MSLDPNNAASASVTRAVLRSMRPDDTDDATEKQRREQISRKFTGALMQGREIPEGAADVNLTTTKQVPSKDRIAVKLPAGHVHAWLEKTVRGMLFFHSQTYVESSHRLEFMPFLTQAGLDNFELMMANLGALYVNGPGIAVRMGIAEDGVSSIYVIRLWEQIYMGAAIQPKAGDLDPAG